MVNLGKVFWCKNFYQLNYIDVISIFMRNLEISLGYEHDEYAWVDNSYPPTMKINLDSLNKDADEYKEEDKIEQYNTLNSRECILFLILHETMHIYLKHFNRVPNNCNYLLWNYATDCEINEILFKYVKDISMKKIRYSNKMITALEKEFITRDYLMDIFKIQIKSNDVAEDIYDKLVEAINKLKKDKPDLPDRLIKLINDDKMVSNAPIVSKNDDISDNQTNKELEKTNDMIDLLRNESEMEASTYNNYRETNTNSILKEINTFLNKDSQFLNIIKKSLKQYDYGLSKNDTQLSWVGYNILFMHVAYMPIKFSKVKKLNRLYLVIDESGSMGDTLLQKLIGIIYGTIKNNIKLKNMTIIHHDTDIEVTENAKDYKYNRHKTGGTSHKKVFEYLQDVIKPNDMVIFVSDLMSDIEEHWHIIESIRYKFSMIWLIEEKNHDISTKKFLEKKKQTIIFR